MDHEFWNEIGNLYFMSGAYEPAIHAYLRSIKLENTFGRSYSNLALAYVRTGKYKEAIKLYRRGIQLLSDNKEKAATWNRLGILYRQIKEYDNALEAYQRADLIMPQEDAQKMSEACLEENLPLTVSMTEIDLDAILAKGNLDNGHGQNDLLAEINAEFEMAESQPQAPIIEDVMASLEFENYSQTEGVDFEPALVSQSEWRFAYADEILLIEKSPQANQESVCDPLEDFNIIIPFDVQSDVIIPDAEIKAPSISEKHPVPVDISEAIDINKESDLAAFFEDGSQPESVENINIGSSVEDSRIDPPLSDLSPDERQSLALEIIKYKEATSKHPRSYILWEGLGEAYKSASQYKDAIRAFQKAISMNPTNHMCHYRLGLVYAAEKKEQEAIKSFKKVLELDPNSAQAHASLASQYRKMGLEQVAQEHIEKARAMQFEGESDYNHACLEAICGNNDRALELLKVALQTKQTYITWAQNDPDLDTLRNDHRFQMLLSSHATIA